MLVFGILVGILATFIQTIGQIVQKKGHMDALRKRQSFICNLTWVCGQSLNLLAVPVFIVSISNTSQTAQSILPAMSIILITIWSCILLGSEFTKWEAMSMAFLIPATMILFIFSSVPKQDIKSEDLKDYVYSPGSVALLISAFLINAGGGLVVYQIMTNFEKIKQRAIQLRDGAHTDAASTRESDMNTMRTQQIRGSTMSHTENTSDNARTISNNSHSPTLLSNASEIHEIDILSYKWAAIPLIYFSFFASFFGTLSNTMLRGLVIIFDDDFIDHDKDEKTFGVAQILIFFMINIVLMFISLFYLNKCLQHFDPIYMIPLIRVFTLMNTIICGGIVYKEFKLYDTTKTVGMLVGTSLCFVGASFYIQRRERVYACKEPVGDDGVISTASYGTIDNNHRSKDHPDNEKRSCKTC